MRRILPICLLALVCLLIGAAAGGLVVERWHRQDGPARRWEGTIYLPLEDNQGKRFAPQVWNDALALLVQEFGGATLGAEQQGCWLDAQQNIQREPVRLVVVSFESNRLADFRRLVRELGRRLGQEAVYVRYEQPRVDLIDVSSGVQASL